jgi:membrane protein YqaA with SNARE-associated domain
MGILGIWKSIPLGFLLKANPVIIGLMTILGALVGILTIFLLGSKVTTYILKRQEKKGKSKKSLRAGRLFGKYGTAGLGFIGTLIIGPNATMALGLIVVKSDKLLLGWTAIGVIVWTIVLTIVATYSIDLFSRIQLI